MQWRTTASEPAIQMVGFALLVIAAVWAVLGYSLWVMRGQIQETARKDVTALTQSLEVHLSASLESARLVLGRTTDMVALYGMSGKSRDPDLLSRLPRVVDHVGRVSGLGVFGADGIIRHAVVRDAEGRFVPVGHEMDVNDRDYVVSMDRHPADTLFVGTPVQSLAGGQWVLPVSRPIRDMVGALSGGAVALIDMQTLMGLFEAVRPGMGGVVSLMRRDGLLLARSPFDKNIIGNNLGDQKVMDRLASSGGSVLTEIVAGADGSDHIQVVAQAKRFPIHIIMTVPLDQVLLDWRAALWRSVIIGLTVALVIGLMALILAAQWRRRQRADAALQHSRQALSASLQRFERAIAGSTAAMWEFDLRTYDGYLAPQWEDMLGWRDVRDPYRTWRDNLHPEDRDRVLTEMRAHLDSHAPFNTEYRLRAANGTWRWVKARGQASWDRHGRPTVMSGTVHDITDLRHGEERLRLALEATQDGLWDWDVARGHLFISTPWKTMLGYRPDAPLPPRITTFLRLLHPDDRRDVVNWMRSFLCTDVNAGGREYRMRTADGAWVWVRAAAKVTERDSSGRPLRVVGTHQDVTGRREELRQLQEARRLAEEGSRAKSAFLATMSHELRTPLNAISGFSESLECQFFGPLNEKQSEYVADIRHSAEHLTSLISDILDMAKIEAGHSQLSDEPVDVAAAIRAKLQMIRQRAAQKGVELIEDLEPLPPYLLDPRRFGQMVLNLLSNAVKFTPSGGAVTIRALSAPDGGLTIAVVDNGIGIAEEDLDRVLEPFTQVDSRLSREYEGTGLGLPLVKAMAEMHGGSLRLTSTLGRGTAASIDFPAARRMARSARPPAVVT
ncbi:MAG: PAS domain-containing protein [Rhodospirillaceae bacterium]